MRTGQKVFRLFCPDYIFLSYLCTHINYENEEMDY